MNGHMNVKQKLSLTLTCYTQGGKKFNLHWSDIGEITKVFFIFIVEFYILLVHLKHF